jgi:hypothetical protein
MKLRNVFTGEIIPWQCPETQQDLDVRIWEQFEDIQYTGRLTLQRFADYSLLLKRVEKLFDRSLPVVIDGGIDR